MKRCTLTMSDTRNNAGTLIMTLQYAAPGHVLLDCSCFCFGIIERTMFIKEAVYQNFNPEEFGQKHELMDSKTLDYDPKIMD